MMIQNTFRFPAPIEVQVFSLIRGKPGKGQNLVIVEVGKISLRF